MISVQANTVVTAAVKRVTEFNRRTLDAMAARLYFYLSLSHEHLGTLSDIRRCVAVPRHLSKLINLEFWRV
jgi:hypothetical protein